MVNITVGSTYQGIINGCLIKIEEIKTYEQFNGVKSDYAVYRDLRTGKKGEAPISRLQRSGFIEVVKEDQNMNNEEILVRIDYSELFESEEEENE